jgi:succinate-semialdehyde dehydrogenase/glutarate-semialdehyde dehydrogenase
LKKTVLELGGSDPYVVLEDADVEQAATTCVLARMINGGQTCVAAKRFIVMDAVREEFTRLVVEKMRAQRMGNPMEEETPLGPMAREDLREALDGQVRRSIAAGATCLLGGEIPEGDEFSGAAYYPATVLDGVKPGMAAFDEELFGPVAAIVPATDRAEAIRLANETPYGLGAAVFTRDLEEGRRIAREELEAGTCVVNDFVASDPRLPFGGVKESGYGRELAREGMREFVNVKVVTVKG